jgi:hypothetical protein
MSATVPTPQKQFLTFIEACILSVYDHKVSLTEIWNAYVLWWDFEGKRAVGGPMLNIAQMQELLNRQYGYDYTNLEYRGLYISYG